MRYVRTFESFRNNKNSKVEPVNEEILGAIGKFFSDMFKKAKEMINKTKGGQEVEEIYYKYLKLIDEQFSKQANVKLNLLSIAKGETKNESMIFEAEEAVATEGTETDTDSEAGGSDAKMTPDTLKQKNDLLTQIVNKMKTTALSEMDAVLKKYGGSAKNPQLAVIIQTRKDQFDLDFMNAKIAFLEKAGDKTMVSEITKQRDSVAKKIEDSLKKVENVKPIEYKEGDTVLYKRDKFNEEEWKKLTDDDKKKTDEGPMKDLQDKEMIGIKKISAVNGDEISFEEADFKKTKSDILMKIEVKATEGEAEAKTEGEAEAKTEGEAEAKTEEK